MHHDPAAEPFSVRLLCGAAGRPVISAVVVSRTFAFFGERGGLGIQWRVLRASAPGSMSATSSSICLMACDPAHPAARLPRLRHRCQLQLPWSLPALAFHSWIVRFVFPASAGDLAPVSPLTEALRCHRADPAVALFDIARQAALAALPQSNAHDPQRVECGCAGKNSQAQIAGTHDCPIRPPHENANGPVQMDSIDDRGSQRAKPSR